MTGLLSPYCIHSASCPKKGLKSSALEENKAERLTPNFTPICACKAAGRNREKNNAVTSCCVCFFIPRTESGAIGEMTTMHFVSLTYYGCYGSKVSAVRKQGIPAGLAFEMWRAFTRPGTSIVVVGLLFANIEPRRSPSI